LFLCGSLMNGLADFFKTVLTIKSAFVYWLASWWYKLKVQPEGKPVVSNSDFFPKVHLYLLSSPFVTYQVTSAKLWVCAYLLSLLSELLSQPPHIILRCTFVWLGARSGVVVKALRYKLAGRRFDSWWCHWNFSAT
jgi:hypothetical protein